MPARNRQSAPTLPSGFERNVLLLDAAEARQLARAAAMRTAGATVQCAATVEDARALWKPGSYQLVLIELQDGGSGFRQFYEYARAQSADQAFGFYTSEPPYLSPDPDGRPAKPARARKPAGSDSRSSFSSSLSEATQQITAARAADRARRGTAEPSLPGSFAAAVRAAEQAVKQAAAESRSLSEESET